MSVLVKGMEMPEKCPDCNFESECGFCLAKSPDFCGYTYELSRPDWCPLVELPKKHGRLVEFIDVATTTDDDDGTESVNLGEAFCAYFKMRESKSVIEAEDEE